MDVSRRSLIASALGAQASGQKKDLRPDVAALARWLHSWVQPSGAVFGFHNHSVWGDNPYRYGDFTCGHSTFASPLIPALARALKTRPDERGLRLVQRLVDFQTAAVQPDGQFAHIGFQVGETLKFGLIHNVVPCVALCEAAGELGNELGGGRVAAVAATVRAVLAVCDKRYGSGVTRQATANQEYCRLWAMLAHMEAFPHASWDDRVRKDLGRLAQDFFVAGLPDADSTGVLRTAADRSLIEPAEYYGLMIHPLLRAHRRYGQRQWLDQAMRLALHVVHSSWSDPRGCRRLHRLWANTGGRWRHASEPMLIGGMGLTVSSIHALDKEAPHPELSAFLGEIDRTYATYQHPGGFFLAATGWHAEQDVIPSSAWQSHDLYYLVLRHGTPEHFWTALFQPIEGVNVAFGDSLMWLETATHWSVRGYETAHGLELAGRKDRDRFAIDIPRWIRDARHADPDLIMPDEPQFYRTDDGIHHSGGRKDVRLFPAMPGK